MSELMMLGVLRMPVTPDSDRLTLKQYIDRGRQAADLIEQQQARIAELEAKTSCCMGVGNGNGRLFVYGDHESIKTAQRYVLERDELAATVDVLREYLRSLIEESTGVVGWHLNGAIADWDEIGATDILGETPQQSLAEHDANLIDKITSMIVDCKEMGLSQGDKDTILLIAQRVKDGES